MFKFENKRSSVVVRFEKLFSFDFKISTFQ